MYRSPAPFTLFTRRQLCFLSLIAALTGALPSRLHSKEQATAEAPAAAETKLALASIFTDHMVLQRDMKIPVWGTAPAGADVKVQLGEDSKKATADEHGKWRVEFKPLEATNEPLEMTVTSDGDKQKFSDVLVGDVWIASGQSNMEWPMTHAKDADSEIAVADWPDIRIIDVANQTGEEPADSFKSAGWQACKPENIGGFSAVAFFFGRELHKHLNVPIGLIGCNWGGTPMEAWTSREALESSPTFKPLVEADRAPAKTPEEEEQRKQLGPHRPASLFNGMLSPVIPYGIRGAIWYQGESNAKRHQQYAELSKLMISDWRNRWGQGDFPFLLVQLAAFEADGDDWPFLREAQTQTLELPNTGMAVTTDIGDQADIHPKNKQDVGARLALAARAVAYDEDVVYSGPVFHEMKTADGKVRISFEHVGGGLKIHAGDALKGFEVAGADGKFEPADATIDGAEVVAWSTAVSDPQAVRYNWSDFPEGNLANAEGLPAVSFRTPSAEPPAEAPPAEEPAVETPPADAQKTAPKAEEKGEAEAKPDAAK